MNEARQTTHEELTDSVVNGFRRLNNNILDKKAPRISWLSAFDDKEPDVKITYLKKLASTMNNAARLIQDERDELVRLMVLKEKQLVAITKQLSDNNEILLHQITKMNAQRQGYVKEVSRLNKELKQKVN